MAHVISAADGGPRANAAAGPESRATYENLLLLCPTCHTIVDKAEAKYPETLLTLWKEAHKQKLASVFGVKSFESRKAARHFVQPILTENRTIFEQYGPMTDERFNPESSVTAQWLRKIRVKIIPNNRRLLIASDANAEHLTEDERKTIELFRQHVDDFEAKHLGESRRNGSQFPPAMERLFAD